MSLSPRQLLSFTVHTDERHHESKKAGVWREIIYEVKLSDVKHTIFTCLAIPAELADNDVYIELRRQALMHDSMTYNEKEDRAYHMKNGLPFPGDEHDDG